MALTEHVKKLALDAVSGKETTAQIRLHSNHDSPAIFNTAEQTAPIEKVVNNDSLRKQTHDAVAWVKEHLKIRLVEHQGQTSPMSTPARDSHPLGYKIAQLHQMGRGLDFIQREITKDGFGRSHDE